jgi:hypothetical protein
MPTKHDSTATRIAKQKGVNYNRGQGPDIVTSREAIEVETADTVKDALRQLRGFRKPVYIAGADQKATEEALKRTQEQQWASWIPRERL